VFLLLVAAHAGAQEQLGASLGKGQAGRVFWDAAEFSWLPGAAGQAGSWQLSVDELKIGRWKGRLEINCRRGSPWAAGSWCQEGAFAWQDSSGTAWSGRLSEFRAADGLGQAFEVEELAASGHVWWPDGDLSRAPALELGLEGLRLENLASVIPEIPGLSFLEGRVRGGASLSDGQLNVNLVLDQVGFDSPDGQIAGEGAKFELSGHLGGLAADELLSFSGEIRQTAGELLFWSVYLPPPDRPLLLELAGQIAESGALELAHVKIDDGGLAAARGSLALVPGEQGWSLASLKVEQSHFMLPQAWQRWGSGPASGYGLADLETAGRLDASLLWSADSEFAIRLDLDSLVAKDGQQRFSAGPLNGYFQLDANRVAAELEWREFSLFSLPFGQSALALEGTRERWGLSEPLEVPLLDGAVVIEQLDWRAAAEAHDSLSMDVHIEPLGLPGLTRVLGWPEFGGRLSGRFPGIRFADNRLDFTGGMDIEAFSGHIAVTDLVIERPFGSLPALAAQVDFERLDLAELTGAFNFGHMDGLLSGWLHDLRLLDWRPVAMDARAYTLADAPRRRISQRAVENLSRLGGGAAAGVGLLRMFDEFSYRRAGLACRLDRNICHLDGVAERDAGGFFIVQGRGLPRLDVVGHRRLVDWPRLVSQLMAISGSAPPSVGGDD